MRLPAVHNSYHQDEYKWAYIVNTTASSEVGRIPHPPLGEIIYRNSNNLLGNDNLRLVPLIFSFVNLFLLFYLAMMLFGRKVALWITLFFGISFYSVLASLMVDTDGDDLTDFEEVAGWQIQLITPQGLVLEAVSELHYKQECLSS